MADDSSSGITDATKNAVNHAAQPQGTLWIPSDFFKYIRDVPGMPTMMDFECRLGCNLKRKKNGEVRYLRVSKTSRCNARRHVEVMHDSDENKLLIKFDEAVASHTDENRKEKTVREKFAWNTDTMQQIRTQGELDFWILNQLVVDVKPLCSVEKPGFKQLISRLIPPSMKLKDRKFFTTFLERQYLIAIDKLFKALAEASDIGSTMDCWTSRRKSYLGETVHWFDQNLCRKSACLAIRRIKGCHTYDVLADLIETLHTEFNITHKVKVATTDNGSNFLKAFRVFGASSTAPSDEDLSSDVDEETDLNFFPITEILVPYRRRRQEDFNQSADFDSNWETIEQYPLLPTHKKCACHLLNLIAKNDIGKIQDRNFQGLRKAVESKLQQVLDKQSWSSKNSDMILTHLDKLFIQKNDTRWNSLFDAMVRLLHIITKQPAALQKVLKELGVEPFRQIEIEYVKEYIKVMKPIVEALDVLQVKENVGMGFLLPTLAILKRNLELMKRDSRIKHCQPLVEGLIVSIDNRFPCFSDNDLKLASISDPRFKLSWISDLDVQEIRMAEKLMKEKFYRESQNSSLSDNISEFPSDDAGETGEEADFSPSRKKTKKDFFSSIRRKPTEDLSEVERYLKEPPGSLDQLNRYPTIAKIFKRYNAGLPASAAVERLFSLAGLIFTPKRGDLTDEHFQMLLFLRINKEVLANW